MRNASRRSFVVAAMSAVAGAWATMSGAGIAMSLLSACKREDTEPVIAEPDSAPVPDSSAAASDAAEAALDSGPEADAPPPASASASASASPTASAGPTSDPAPRKYGGVPAPTKAAVKYGAHAPPPSTVVQRPSTAASVRPTTAAATPVTSRASCDVPRSELERASTQGAEMPDPPVARPNEPHRDASRRVWPWAVKRRVMMPYHASRFARPLRWHGQTSRTESITGFGRGQ